MILVSDGEDDENGGGLEVVNKTKSSASEECNVEDFDADDLPKGWLAFVMFGPYAKAVFDHEPLECLAV